MRLDVLFNILPGKRIALSIGALFVISVASAQVPYISSLSKSFGKTQETISITGINFGTSTANMDIWFGGVLANPTSISDQFIEVQVPLGATFDFIRVSNVSTGLSASSKDAFMPSFGGQNPFVETRVGSQQNFNSESGLYDMTVADFDGDGKQDVVTANDNSNVVSVFLNTSTAGTINFTKTTLNPVATSIHIASGDVNGDGKPDVLLAQENSNRVFIFKNTSTVGVISFTMQSLTLPAVGSFVNQIRVEDMDLDGKPELIMSEQSASRIFIARNQSTLSTISFATPQSIPLGGNNGTDAVAIGDLNGDHFPDVVVGEFLAATSSIYILKNACTPGVINLINQTPLSLSTSVSNIAIGDFNGDQKPDIAASLLLANSLAVFGNQSSNGEISLATPVTFEAGIKPWGIDLGDIDGDGKLDIAVANIVQKSIQIRNNQSTPTTFAFTRNVLNTTFINRTVELVDMDLDGRSDIAFASVDDNTLGIPASKLSVFRNVNCVIPTVTPTGPLSICNGFNQRLESSINQTATYEWLKDGVSQGAPGTTSFIDVTSTGAYTVRMVEGTCSQTSNAVQVNVVAAAPLGPATISPVSPVCLNGTLNLSASNVGATQYSWTGPGGFAATGISVSRTNFQASMAGEYNLEVISGTCVAERLSVVVDVVSVPEVTVQFSGSDIICTGDSKQLSVFPVVTGYNYQWAELTSGDIDGATGTTHTINSTGKYLVKLTSVASPGCAPITTAEQKIRVASYPVIDFDFPAGNCTNQQIVFTDQSVVDIDPEDTEVNYAWDFGDGQTSNEKDPTHTFTTAQNYDVELTVRYRDNSCEASGTQVITLVAPPSIQITNPDNVYSLCPNTSLRLEVLNPAATSYLWGTGETTPFFIATLPGMVTVQVMAGCQVSAQRNITAFPAPNITATAEPATVNLGGSIVLQANGLTDYHWKPNLGVDDSLSSVTNATPSANTVYTVYGTDANGCYGEASVEVTIILTDPLTVFEPASFLTPNGDDRNQVWLAGKENMPILDQCSVTIFDERGFKVYEAKPYLNDWEGISQKGQVLPSGVYFYLIQCDDSSRILTGSINLIR